jgi:translation elongation factor EF-G
MSTALYKMVKADPSLRLEVDQETGQTLLRGMGELHLEVTIDRMRTELGVEANMGRPRVSFREAFGTSVELVYTHKKQSGGSGQYAEVKMVFEPLPAGTGVEFSTRSSAAASLRVHSERRARDRDRVQARPGRGLRGRRLQGALLDASTTTSTRRRSRSRSRGAPASAKRTDRAGRSCSSRS